MITERIPGIPEGLRLVRIGRAKTGEHYLQGRRAVRQQADCGYVWGDPELGVIVEAVPGYTLAQSPDDPYSLVPVQQFPRPRKLLATFEIHNSAEEADLTAKLNAIPNLKALSNLP